MADEYIRLDTTIIGIDNLINKAKTAAEANELFKAKDVIYSQQRYTADVQPVKRGKWEEIEDFYGDSHYGCTACGAEFYLEAGTPSDNEYYYCPHCGADMLTKG